MEEIRHKFRAIKLHASVQQSCRRTTDFATVLQFKRRTTITIKKRFSLLKASLRATVDFLVI